MPSVTTSHARFYIYIYIYICVCDGGGALAHTLGELQGKSNFPGSSRERYVVSIKVENGGSIKLGHRGLVGKEEEKKGWRKEGKKSTEVKDSREDVVWPSVKMGERGKERERRWNG